MLKNKIIFIIGLFLPSLGFSDSLDVGTYRQQVLGSNLQVIGQLATSQGAFERVHESELPVAWRAFANAQVTNDKEEPVIPIVLYDRLRTDIAQIGVSKDTDFGLQSRVYYDYRRTSYINVNSPFAFNDTYYENRPVVELTQSFWGNGFGRGIRAQTLQIKATALAAQFSACYDARLTLVNAELAYWRLATAREAIKINQDALLAAQRIFEWSRKRTDLHLADEADALQATAALRVRELELKAAQDEERVAARSFNTLRFRDSEEVAETLDNLVNISSATIFPAVQPTIRDDVRAADQQQQLALANAQSAIERNRPTLDLYTLFAWNGLDNSFSSSLSKPFEDRRPTSTVGVRFSIPLAFSALDKTLQGYRREQAAAQQVYEQRQFEALRDWTDLQRKLKEAQERLSLYQSIEEAQRVKTERERQRLRNGRTTTYQVLLFEQEYAVARLSRLNSQFEVVSLLAQTSLYKETL